MLHVTEFEPHYDAIIVGARCAGAATAMLLAKAGLRVLAVDRQAYGSDTLSTHALMRPAVMQLSRWGLLEPLIRSGAPVIELDHLPLWRAGGRGPDPAGARHSRADRSAPDGARPHAGRRGARAGATVLHDTSVHDLTFDPHGRVRGVVLEDAAGRTRNVWRGPCDRRRRLRLVCRPQGRGAARSSAGELPWHISSAMQPRRSFRDIIGISDRMSAAA